MKFKTRKEIDSYFKGNKIKCLLCGGFYKALPTHLVKIHNISVDEYKKKFGLPWGRGLIADNTRIKISTITKKRCKTDPRMKMTDELMHKAQQAPKRPIMEYRKKECSLAFVETINNRKAKSIIEANKILDMMEKEKLPACYCCLFDNLSNYHVLQGAMKYHKPVKERYNKIKKEIPKLLELKTGFKNKQLSIEMKKMKAEGKTQKEIAKYFHIAEKTVNKYINL